ncbi:MAG: TetR/AcrR family transcriptional regulator [Sphingobium sp.]
MKDEKNPVASRREVRRQDRREAIMAVASSSFLDHGYSGTTMSGIASTLGGSKGTLWSYFSSKEELFAAVIDDATRAYRLQLTQILDDPCNDLRQTLRRFCISIMEKVTSPDAIALYRLVAAEAGRFPEMGRIFYDRAPRQTHMLLAGFLKDAMDRGQLRIDDPLDTARLLINLCVTGCQQTLVMSVTQTVAPEMIAAEVDRATELFMRGYAHEPANP